MPRLLTVAALLTHHDWNQSDTVGRLLALARRAADRGAQLVLPSDLFEAPCFCKTGNPRYRDLARPVAYHARDYRGVYHTRQPEMYARMVETPAGPPPRA